MTDIVERMLTFQLNCDSPKKLNDLLDEAIYEIERLSQRVKFLEELYAEEVRSWGTLGGHLTMSENNG